MPRRYRVVQCDVFTERALGGNPLAVVLGAETLSTAEMQAIAREMNLAETTFILPAEPGTHARVRIFTPGREMPFAGHPTIGTAFVLAWERLLPPGACEIVLGENIGPVPVTFEGDPAAPRFAWMRHRPAEFGPEVMERAAVAAALGVAEDDLIAGAPVQTGTTGLPFLYVPLRTPAAVDRVALDWRAIAPHAAGADGVFLFAPDGNGGVYARMLAADALGVGEDPATGSASGPLGAYCARHKLVAVNEDGTVRFVSRQGVAMGRPSDIHVRLHHDAHGARDIEVGGCAVAVLDGTLTLPDKGASA